MNDWELKSRSKSDAGMDTNGPETETEEEAERKHKNVDLVEAAFALVLGNFFLQWIVVLVIEFSGKREFFPTSAMLFGGLSLLLSSAGFGTLASKVDISSKKKHIVKTIGPLLVVADLAVVVNTCIIYYDHPAGTGSFVQTIWGGMTVFLIMFAGDMYTAMSSNYIIRLWFLELLKISSTVAGMADLSASGANFDALTYSFTVNFIIFPFVSPLPQLRKLKSRVIFMAILAIATNIPTVLAAIAGGQIPGSVGFMIFISIIQCCHDLVFEPVKMILNQAHAKRKHTDDDSSSRQQEDDSNEGPTPAEDMPEEWHSDPGSPVYRFVTNPQSPEFR